MSKVKARDIIILTVLLIFLLDYVFIKYVLGPVRKDIKATKQQIISVDNTIASNISTFNNLLKIPNDLKRLKKAIIEQKTKNILLQEKTKTADELSDILKTFLLESGIEIDKVALASSNKEGNIVTYNFALNFKTNTQNLIKFMDKVENSVSFMDISSYSLKNSENELTVEMNVRSKYLVQE